MPLLEVSKHEQTAASLLPRSQFGKFQMLFEVIVSTVTSYSFKVLFFINLQLKYTSFSYEIYTKKQDLKGVNRTVTNNFRHLFNLMTHSLVTSGYNFIFIAYHKLAKQINNRVCQTNILSHLFYLIIHSLVNLKGNLMTRLVKLSIRHLFKVIMHSLVPAGCNFIIAMVNWKGNLMERLVKLTI